MSDNYDTADTDSEDLDDSPVLRKVRAEKRAAEKELAEIRKKLEEVETAAQTRRAEAAEGAVNRLGFPGLKDDVLSWIDGDITDEKVVEAMKARSIPLPEGFQESSDERELVDEPTVGVASNVGQRVADAAGGRDQRTLEDKIANASSTAEVAELMEQAGLTRSHS